MVQKRKKLCKPGIEAKFAQNPRAMQSLLETGEKQLVECAKDRLWGTGSPIFEPNCLDKNSWKTPGILGAILEEIREVHLRQARTLPWSKALFPAPGIMPTSHMSAHQTPLHPSKQPVQPNISNLTSSPVNDQPAMPPNIDCGDSTQASGLSL